MGMFDSYNNLTQNYMPDNSSTPINVNDVIFYDDKLPRKAYDVKKRFIGFSWNYGDTFTLQLDINDDIKVYESTIIYSNSGEKPSGTTEGNYVGQKAINITDQLSWTYIGEANSYQVWMLDKEFCYPADGDISIELNTNMEGKKIIVDIFNFRWEPIHRFENENSNTINCIFDMETSSKFKKGIYYAAVKISNGDKSVLKKKYMFIVGDKTTNEWGIDS